jgi:membrane-bound lytic murein transglycosylase D
MKKNSIILLGILFSINILSQNINKKDTFIDVPSDYENAVEAMMKDRILRRFVFDLCDGEASPVFYSDSVYIARLQKLPYRIEMPYNSIVRSFIDRYAKNIRQID